MKICKHSFALFTKRDYLRASMHCKAHFWFLKTTNENRKQMHFIDAAPTLHACTFTRSTKRVHYSADNTLREREKKKQNKKRDRNEKQDSVNCHTGTSSPL